MTPAEEILKAITRAIHILTGVTRVFLVAGFSPVSNIQSEQMIPNNDGVCG